MSKSLFNVGETVDELLVLLEDLATVLSQVVSVQKVIDELGIVEILVNDNYGRVVRVLDEEFGFEGGLAHVVLVGAERVVGGEEQEYVLGDLQLLDAAVDHVDFLRHFLVAAVGPDLQAAVVQLLNVGVLELVEEQDFDVRDVFGVLLEVGLFQVCLTEFRGGWEGVQAPDLLPDPRPLFIPLDVRFLGLLVDPHLERFREQFPLSLAQLQWVQAYVFSWVFLLVNLFVDINAHNDQLGCADH